MTKKWYVLLAGLALASAGSVIPANGATFVFHDEFSGTTLNTATWTAQTGKSGGLCSSAANSRVSGGFLNMTVRRGSTADCPWVGNRVISEGKRSLGYGLVQTRAKWNAVPGSWDGFVMFGTPSGGRRLADGEIDTEITNGVIHYRLWSVNAAGKRCGVPIDKSSQTLDQWHTFGVNRQSTNTQFLLDGVKQATITKAQMVAKGCTWPFTRRFSMVLSARAGGYGGTPVASRFPVTSSVDWVRQ
jgi:beta-glucanase (GH16 family)